MFALLRKAACCSVQLGVEVLIPGGRLTIFSDNRKYAVFVSLSGGQAAQGKSSEADYSKIGNVVSCNLTMRSLTVSYQYRSEARSCQFLSERLDQSNTFE